MGDVPKRGRYTKDYKLNKYRGGHEREFLVTQWSEESSIIVYQKLFSDRNNKFVTNRNFDIIFRRRILLTFYMVMYPRDTFNPSEPEKPLFRDSTETDLYSERITVNLENIVIFHNMIIMKHLNQENIKKHSSPCKFLTRARR